MFGAHPVAVIELLYILQMQLNAIRQNIGNIVYLYILIN